MNPFQSLFPGADPKKMEDTIRKANQFLTTAEGQQMLRQLEKNPSLKTSLREAQAKGISRLSSKDRNMLLSALRENPAMLTKLQDFLR